MELSELNSPTYSVNSNLLKLNSSSIASSTPGCSHQGPLIVFEQFEQSQHTGRPSLPKKNLTIQIDQDYDYKQSTEQQHSEVRHPVLMIPTPESMVEQYSPIAADNDAVRGLQGQVREWRQRYQSSESARLQLMEEIDLLHSTLKKKDQLLLHQQQVNNNFAHKLAQFEQLQAQDKYYDEKMRQKQTKYKELLKVHQKVVAMNKVLQRDLRQSEKKIMELEKDIQKNVCNAQHQNLLKIRQSSTRLKQSTLKMTSNTNKENAISNGVKSIDRRRGGNATGNGKKGVRVSSSSTNIQKKLQLKGA